MKMILLIIRSRFVYHSSESSFQSSSESIDLVNDFVITSAHILFPSWDDVMKMLFGCDLSISSTCFICFNSPGRVDINCNSRVFE